jgi:hypothetical protein
METIKDIETEMGRIMVEGSPPYDKIMVEYERLLSIMGNVDGNEVIALVLLALHNVEKEDDSIP